METKRQPKQPVNQTGDPKPTQKDQASESAAAHSPASLDHGVSSLVAQDSPDDSQLGAPTATAEPDHE